MKTAFKLIGGFFLLILLALNGGTKLYAGQKLGGEQKSLEDEKEAQITRLARYYNKALQGKKALILPWESFLIRSLDDTNSHLLQGDYYNMEALAQALIYNDSLELLEFSMTTITDEAVKHLCRALQFNNILKKIYVQQSKITSKGVARLLSSENIEQLYLRDNIILGEDEISKALLLNKTLKTLELSRNSLDKDALEKIINVAKNKQNLIELHFGDGVPLSIQNIQALFSMPKLISLGLIIDPKEPEVITTLVSALMNDAKLAIINIRTPSDSKLSDANFEDIYNALESNYNLTSINIAFYDVGKIDKQIEIINKITQRNESFIEKCDGFIEIFYVWNAIKYFAPALFGMGDSDFQELLPEVKKVILLTLVKTMKYSYLTTFRRSIFFQNKSLGAFNMRFLDDLN
jgi:hypothetical protein